MAPNGYVILDYDKGEIAFGMDEETARMMAEAPNLVKAVQALLSISSVPVKSSIRNGIEADARLAVARALSQL